MTLDETLQQLYHVFSRYPLAAQVEGCAHCVFDEDHALIHSAPLRHLTKEALEKYSFKAMSTWGTSQDFRHFLPRIFELQARDTMWPTDVELAFGKLAYGKWKDWPPEEQAAIRQYFEALWKDVLGNRSISEESSDMEAVHYLGGIGYSGENLEPYLTIWTEADLKYKKDHFLAAVDWFGETLQGAKRLAGGYWEPEPSAIVQAWFARQETWLAFGLTRPW